MQGAEMVHLALEGWSERATEVACSLLRVMRAALLLLLLYAGRRRCREPRGDGR